MSWPEDFAADITAETERDAPLAPLTSLRVGGPARLLVRPWTLAGLAQAVSWLRRRGVSWRILGGGTNLVVPDEGFDGAIVRMEGELAGFSWGGLTLTAGAGARLPRVLGECVRRGASGLECLAGIPGTVGGALLMNAGGRWGEISDHVRSVLVLREGGGSGGAEAGAGKVPVRELRVLGGRAQEGGSPRKGPGDAAAEPGGLSQAGSRDAVSLEAGAGPPQEEDRSDSAATFGYRSSSLAGEVVVGAVFELEEAPPGEVRERARSVIEGRRAGQPLGARSAGCIFRNPPDAPPAGRLLDEAGMKGRRRGGAVVSQLHANFVVNEGSATAADVLGLIREMREAVLSRFGVDLSPEVELW